MVSQKNLTLILYSRWWNIMTSDELSTTNTFSNPTSYYFTPSLTNYGGQTSSMAGCGWEFQRLWMVLHHKSHMLTNIDEMVATKHISNSQFPLKKPSSLIQLKHCSTEQWLGISRGEICYIELKVKGQDSSRRQYYTSVERQWSFARIITYLSVELLRWLEESNSKSSVLPWVAHFPMTSDNDNDDALCKLYCPSACVM